MKKINGKKKNWKNSVGLIQQAIICHYFLTLEYQCDILSRKLSCESLRGSKIKLDFYCVNSKRRTVPVIEGFLPKHLLPNISSLALQYLKNSVKF